MKTLRSAYRASPYFEHYENEICDLLLAKHDFLHQLSAAALTFCLNKAGYLHPIEIIGKVGPVGIENTDFSHILTAESGASPDILPFPEYRSVFGAEFDASVSILDSLFCVGPHRLQAYLRRYKG
jgi:hypothetical protein